MLLQRVPVLTTQSAFVTENRLKLEREYKDVEKKIFCAVNGAQTLKAG
jgi:hypothetical protein